MLFCHRFQHRRQCPFPPPGSLFALLLFRSVDYLVPPKTTHADYYSESPPKKAHIALVAIGQHIGAVLFHAYELSRDNVVKLLHDVSLLSGRRFRSSPSVFHTWLLGLVPLALAANPTANAGGQWKTTSTTPIAPPQSTRSRASPKSAADLLAFVVGIVACAGLVVGARYARKRGWKLPEGWVMGLSGVAFFVWKNDGDVIPRVTWLYVVPTIRFF
jgi:hypothetical protein